MWLYVAVRKDFVSGAFGSQVAHAASEVASQWTYNHDAEISTETRAAILGATKEQLAHLQAQLVAGNVPHKAILETDGPLAGCTTAIGVIAADRDELCKRVPLLDRNNPDGLKRYK